MSSSYKPSYLLRLISDGNTSVGSLESGANSYMCCRESKSSYWHTLTERVYKNLNVFGLERLKQYHKRLWTCMLITAMPVFKNASLNSFLILLTPSVVQLLDELVLALVQPAPSAATDMLHVRLHPCIWQMQMSVPTTFLARNSCRLLALCLHTACLLFSPRLT